MSQIFVSFKLLVPILLVLQLPVTFLRPNFFYYMAFVIYVLYFKLLYCYNISIDYFVRSHAEEFIRRKEHLLFKIP